MILVEVNRLRFDPRPILHRLSNPCGKLGFGRLTTFGALLDLGLMLGHLDLDLG